MSYVSRISGSNPLSPSQRANAHNPNSLAHFPISFHESFEFPQKRLTIQEGSNTRLAAQERPFYEVLLKLFTEILKNNVDIAPTQPKDNGKYATEAFFRPAEGVGTRPAIYLPLPVKALDKKNLRLPSGTQLSDEFKKIIKKYVEKVVDNFTDEQILRLIIVGSHEYGHYQSFLRGNHDENLKRGLFIFQKRYLNISKADEYTWLVFREECQAWGFAETFLRKTKFSYWNVYDEVKSNSLKTYFLNLNLINASLETYYHLSFLGDDFARNSPSGFFNKEKMDKKAPDKPVYGSVS